MATIKQALQNLKNNSLGYYPCLVGGKLHINRDGNSYMLVRNETPCQWNKHTGVVCVLGETVMFDGGPVEFDNRTPHELRIYNIGRQGVSL